jgi:hypothetical protein
MSKLGIFAILLSVVNKQMPSPLAIFSVAHRFSHLPLLLLMEVRGVKIKDFINGAGLLITTISLNTGKWFNTTDHA